MTTADTTPAIPLRFLMCTVPSAGHTNPGLPIARALIERGHQVHWYTGREFRAAIEATGAIFEPLGAAIDPVDQSLESRFPERAGLEGLAGFKFDLKHFFLDEVPAQIDDVRRILTTFPADVLLVDTGFFAAGMLHELEGPVWATYGITALPIGSSDTAPFGTGLLPGRSRRTRLRNRLLTALSDNVMFRDVNRHRRTVRALLDLPRDSSDVLSSTLSPYLYLHSSTPAFEYPRSDLPSQVHFVGPLVPAAPPEFVAPDWWPELVSGRPVVLVNQATVATDLDDLIVPALRGLADEPVVVVATGGSGDQGISIAVPDNAHVARYVPFAALLPHVSVMVTNGGYGGVQFALSHGVPLVVAGTTEDKPEVAARVEWSGAGVNLRTKTPTPEQIRDAVRVVLTDQRYRANAERIRDEYAGHDAAEESADLMERLAVGQRPVQREVLAGHSGHSGHSGRSGRSGRSVPSRAY